MMHTVYNITGHVTTYSSLPSSFVTCTIMNYFKPHNIDNILILVMLNLIYTSGSLHFISPLIIIHTSYITNTFDRAKAEIMILVNHYWAVNFGNCW